MEPSDFHPAPGQTYIVAKTFTAATAKALEITKETGAHVTWFHLLPDEDFQINAAKNAGATVVKVS